MWVVAGLTVLASSAMGQSRRHSFDDLVGHSEQGRVTSLSTRSSSSESYRMMDGGAGKNDGNALGRVDAGGAEFRGAPRLLDGSTVLPAFGDLGGTPFIVTNILVLNEEGAVVEISEPIVSASGAGVIPSPGTLMLLGAGAAMGLRRRR